MDKDHLKQFLLTFGFMLEEETGNQKFGYSFLRKMPDGSSTRYDIVDDELQIEHFDADGKVLLATWYASFDPD